MGEALAGEADGRRVDDGRHLFNVIAKQPVEKCLVAILKRDEIQVAVDVIGLPLEVFVDPGELLLDGQARRRQQTVDFELDALGGREAGALVQNRIIEQRPASFVNRKKFLPGHRVRFRLEAVHALFSFWIRSGRGLWRLEIQEQSTCFSFVLFR